MPSRQRKKEATRRAKYLQVRDDVLESARACYKAELEKKRSAKRQRVLNLLAWRRECDAGRLPSLEYRGTNETFESVLPNNVTQRYVLNTHIGAHVATYSYYKLSMLLLRDAIDVCVCVCVCVRACVRACVCVSHIT